MKLTQSILFVKDVPRMLQFYRDGLGLRELVERSSEGWVELEAGSVVLALHAAPSAIAQRIEITSPPKARSQAPIKLVFQVDNVAQACLRLNQLGGVFTPPANGEYCDGLDPEGNVLQLVGAAFNRASTPR